MRLKTLSYLLLSALFLGFPFEHFRCRILRPFSQSLYEKFQATAPYCVEIPKFIEKNIHFYLSDILILSVAVLLFFSKKLRFRDFLTDKHSRFLTFLFFLALLSILHSDCCRYYYLYFSLFNLAMAFLAFHITSQFFKGQEALIHRLLWALLIIAALECFIGMGQFLTQKSLGLRILGEHKLYIDRDPIASFPLPEKGRWFLELFSSIPAGRHSVLRIYGTFPHPNFFAGFLVLTLLVSNYCFATARKKWQRVAITFLILIQIITLYLTFSRAGIFAYILGSCIWFGLALFKKGKPLYEKKRPIIFLASFIAASFLLSFMVLLPLLTSRGGFINYNTLVQQSDAGRIAMQNISLEIMKHHPILGVGYNCFTFFPGEFLSKPSFSRDRPHNIYLLLISEMGILGLGCFILFLFSLVRSCFIRISSPIFQTLLAVFISYLFIGACDLYFLVDQVGKLMFFPLSGLLAAAGASQEETNPKVLSGSASSQTI